MAKELSHVLITPYSIRKSRTGSIISRLLSRSGLELVGGRMFAPGRELVERYAATIVTESEPRHRRTQELIRDYVTKNFGPDDHGLRSRVLLLAFEGEDAVARIRHVVGHIVHERTSGETIRDTFGDYVTDGDDVVYFEPAALAPQTPKEAEENLRLWTEYSESDGGILENILPYPEGSQPEKTLVLIKPDNFRFPNGRPGGVIDLFSRTGLRIIGFKVHHMSVAEAEEFYRPVLDMLQDKFREPIGKRARMAVEEELGFELDEKAEKDLGELFGPGAGRHHWESIIRFMAGRRPSECGDADRHLPGPEKCVALVYEGIDAVRKIREVLGPTDPSKAPFGTIRREFGQTMMINAAHASDSVENAKRELEIIRIRENNLKALIESRSASA